MFRVGCCLAEGHFSASVYPNVRSPFRRMFGMVLEKIFIPEIQKVSGTIEKKICAVGITKILTECPAMMDTDYTKLW